MIQSSGLNVDPTLTRSMLKAKSEQPHHAYIIDSNFLPECSLHTSGRRTTSNAPEVQHLLCAPKLQRIQLKMLLGNARCLRKPPC